MRRKLIFQHHGRKHSIGWISLQPDGSISCGLSDRAYVSPRFKSRIGIWNAYNRYAIRYELPHNPNALVPVSNPHFTFHPAISFHLKGQLDRSQHDEDLFSAIADVSIALQQQHEMPWLRLTSRPLGELPEAGVGRDDGIENIDMIYSVPTVVTTASASIEVDFIRAEAVVDQTIQSQWQCIWHGRGIRVKLGTIPPQIATLSWFHEC